MPPTDIQWADVPLAYAPILVADGSWDVATTLRPDQAQTPRLEIRFPCGVMVVGFHAVVRPLLWGSFAASGQFPDADDVLVDWDVYKRNHLTSNETLDPSTSTQQAQGRSTLKALTLDRRLIYKPLPPLGGRAGAAPTIGFVFSNPYPLAPDDGALPGALRIRLTVFTVDLKETIPP